MPPSKPFNHCYVIELVSHGRSNMVNIRCHDRVVGENMLTDDDTSVDTYKKIQRNIISRSNPSHTIPSIRVHIVLHHIASTNLTINPSSSFSFEQSKIKRLNYALLLYLFFFLLIFLVFYTIRSQFNKSGIINNYN